MSKKITILFVLTIITMQNNFAMETGIAPMRHSKEFKYKKNYINIGFSKDNKQGNHNGLLIKNLVSPLQYLDKQSQNLNSQLQNVKSNENKLINDNAQYNENIKKNTYDIARNKKLLKGAVATGVVVDFLAGGSTAGLGTKVGFYFAGTMLDVNMKLTFSIEHDASKLKENNNLLTIINHDKNNIISSISKINASKDALDEKINNAIKIKFNNSYYPPAEDDIAGTEIAWRAQDRLVPMRQKCLSLLEWVPFVNEAIISYMDPDYYSLKFLSQTYGISNFEDLLIKDSDNNTILHRACRDNEIESIKIICQITQQHNQDLIFQPNNDGFLPIHQAASFGHATAIDTLIQMQKNAGIDPWELIAHCDNEGRYTALHIAVINGEIEATKILINNLANDKVLELLLMQDRYNLTALQNAQAEGHTELVNILTESLENQLTNEVLLNIIQQQFDYPPSFGQSLLMKEDKVGNTVLHLACKQDDINSIMKIYKLLDQDNMEKLIFHPNTNGFMPIHAAAEQENVEIIKLFMQIAEINMLNYLTTNSEIDLNTENQTKIFNFLKDVCLKQIDCSICWEEKNGSEYYTINCCNDKVCKECLLDHLTVCLDKGKLEELICPNQNCLKTIEEPTMRAITLNNKAVYNRYLEIGLNEYLNGDLGEYLNGEKQKECQQKQCLSPDCPNRFIPDPDCNEIMACDGCKNVYCSYCLFKHNLNITCEQAKMERDPDFVSEATMAWIANNTKQCTSCGHAVERNEGCNHMTCKCGYEFCYVCGKVWGSLSCPFYNHPPV